MVVLGKLMENERVVAANSNQDGSHMKLDFKGRYLNAYEKESHIFLLSIISLYDSENVKHADPNYSILPKPLGPLLRHAHKRI